MVCKSALTSPVTDLTVSVADSLPVSPSASTSNRNLSWPLRGPDAGEHAVAGWSFTIRSNASVAGGRGAHARTSQRFFRWRSRLRSAHPALSASRQTSTSQFRLGRHRLDVRRLTWRGDVNVALIVTPCHVADIVTIPMVPKEPNALEAVTGNEALNARAGTITEAGMVTAVLLDDKPIVAGPAAFAVSATEQVLMSPTVRV